MGREVLSAQARVSMSAFDFMAEFGASCRTKNTLPQPNTLRGLVHFGWEVARGRRTDRSRRLYPVPARSKLPREFIRLDPWEAEYLFMIASMADVGIVEIGRLRGGSTFLLACANRNVPIWSVDVAPAADEELEELFARHEIGENVHLLVGDSQHAPLPEIGEFDLLFVDGSHLYEAVKGDLELFFLGLAPGGHVVLHDCRGGYAVQQAALEFIDETEVEVIRSPYTPAAHWLTDYGSMAHFRKPGGRR